MLVPSSSTPRVPLQDTIQVFWALQDASDLSTLRMRILDEHGLNFTRVQQLGEEGTVCFTMPQFHAHAATSISILIHVISLLAKAPSV
jgi:hypothetical protein